MNSRTCLRCSVLLVAAGLLVAGCAKSEDKDAQAKGKETRQSTGTKHGSWWCAEHGIPEKDCSMCLPEEEVKKRFKDKGDWCEKHDRAKSQCFICNPKLREDFAKEYRRKYPGKEPPEPTENMPPKEKKGE
jgi:hypothetical protein